MKRRHLLGGGLLALWLGPAQLARGASLLGLRGLVFKSHGGEDAYGFEWAIRRAYDAAHHDVLARIEKSIAELMPQTAAAPETNL